MARGRASGVYVDGDDETGKDAPLCLSRSEQDFLSGKCMTGLVESWRQVLTDFRVDQCTRQQFFLFAQFGVKGISAACRVMEDLLKKCDEPDFNPSAFLDKCTMSARRDLQRAYKDVLTLLHLGHAYQPFATVRLAKIISPSKNKRDLAQLL